MPDPYNNPYPNPSYQNQNGYNQNGYNSNGNVPGKGAATASLVLGIVGMFFAGIILGILGLYYAAKAKREGFVGGIRTAGFVLSLLALIFGAVSVACLICNGGLYACLGSTTYY